MTKDKTVFFKSCRLAGWQTSQHEPAWCFVAVMAKQKLDLASPMIVYFHTVMKIQQCWRPCMASVRLEDQEELCAGGTAEWGVGPLTTTGMHPRAWAILKF